MLNDRFLKIDRRLLNYKGLKANEKLVIALISSSKNRCFMSNAYISSSLGISVREVDRCLKYLKDNGYIDIYYEKNSREIVLLGKTWAIWC